MAAFVKYEQFALDLAAGVHTLTTAGSTLSIGLSNTAPAPTTDALLVDASVIAYTNISSPAMPADTLNTAAENPAGTWDVVGTDIVITASGNVAQFQYVILYNSTEAGGPLIGYWDNGAPVDLVSGNTFTINFGAQMFTIA